MTAEGLLLPDVEDPEAAEFWAGAARGELLVQACGACGARRMPPRPMCPRCHSIDVTWERSAGLGTVWSFVVPHRPLLPAYAELAPYNVIVVALDDDPTIRFVGNLVTGPDGAINELDPHSISIGEPVRVVFSRIDATVTLPRWMRV